MVRFNKLDLNQLAVLDEILSTRSVSKAAERLSLSQPATSCALRRLREYFDDDLLVPIGRVQVLTPLAVELRKPIRDVLLQIQAITRTRPGFDPATSTRRFTIESSDYVVCVFLSEVLRRVGEYAPQMQFDLRPLSPRTPENLENGEIELVVTPELFADHPREALFDDGFVCVVWERTCAYESVITVDEYFSATHVVVEWEGGRITTLDARAIEAGGHGRKRDGKIIASGFTLVPEFIVGTSHISTLPTRLAYRMAERFPLRVLKCPVFTPRFVEHVQWHKYQEHDPAIVWLRSVFREVVDGMSG
ncbi:LysR family transcriptional regulator [Burkholderia cenocepacia]|uniref:LysR family transcriptional regulator n=1 Tax=Burkholderia cenocepacia TaxID=95486 RepID=UPI00210AECA6|nr:LysR family transcriptional regulator [Burkholderia cenocepacia]